MYDFCGARAELHIPFLGYRRTPTANAAARSVLTETHRRVPLTD